MLVAVFVVEVMILSFCWLSIPLVTRGADTRVTVCVSYAANDSLST
jgi:hypothetical protein